MFLTDSALRFSYFLSREHPSLSSRCFIPFAIPFTDTDTNIDTDTDTDTDTNTDTDTDTDTDTADRE